MNAHCPRKDKGACTKTLCGHCPKCGSQWDNHNGLTMDGKPPPTCPKIT